MPALVCPHCQKSNPEEATYCFFDGAMLKGSGAGASPNRLASPFVFPSGRSCGTFDELVQGCQEEWTAARDMLMQGHFQNFFSSAGRFDLVKSCQEAQAQADPDIGLSQMLGALPTLLEIKGPKLDINPRRPSLGKVMAGDTRKLHFKVVNTGQGMLQGTLSVTEGNEWLKLGAGSADGQVAIKTSKEQAIPLTADTRGLAAGEPYAAKMRIITNGGVEEVPLRIDIGAHPYPKAPFQGAKSPREMAVKMRDNPKAAAALLESGELPKWFASNGWTYPISGTPARGVAGVQQFFELMGLAKPPVVKLSHREVRLQCKVPDNPQFQVKVAATTKKYVYANVVTDAPWLKILAPSVSGAQNATVAFEIDSRYLPPGKVAETNVQFLANGNQKLAMKVRVDIQRSADTPLLRFTQPIIIMALAFLLLRMLIAPVVDFYARPAATAAAVTKSRGTPKENSAATSMAGWLRLPWMAIFLGQAWHFPDDFLGKGIDVSANNYQENFRDYFVQSFVTRVVLLTWWVGGLLGAFILFARNGFIDGLWGLLSGSILGIIFMASISCMLLLIDLFPGLAMYLVFSGSETTIIHLLIWVVLTAIWWTVVGAGLGFVLMALGPVGKVILNPVRDLFAGFFRLCGLRGLANLSAAR